MFTLTASFRLFNFQINFSCSAIIWIFNFLLLFVDTYFPLINLLLVLFYGFNLLFIWFGINIILNRFISITIITFEIISTCFTHYGLFLGLLFLKLKVSLIHNLLPLSNRWRLFLTNIFRLFILAYLCSWTSSKLCSWHRNSLALWLHSLLGVSCTYVVGLLGLSNIFSIICLLRNNRLFCWSWLLSDVFFILRSGHLLLILLYN